MKLQKWLPLALLSLGTAAMAADERPPASEPADAESEAASSSTAPPHRSAVPEFLQPFDTDVDGVLSQEELGAAREALKNRRVQKSAEWSARTPDERSAAREAVRAELEAKRLRHFAEAAGDDSLIDLDEFLAISAFAKLARKSPERAAAIFAHLDSDGNGAVSAAEFLGNLRPVRPARPKVKPEDRERPAARGADRN